MSNKFDTVLKILGTKGQCDDPTSNDLVKVRSACARALVDFNDLQSENLKLIEENAKMTKRKVKLECKLKSAVRESKTILHEVKLAVKYYEEKMHKDVVNKLTFKKFKQILKNYSK